MYLEDECPCRGMGWIIRWGGVMTGLVGHMTPDGWNREGWVRLELYAGARVVDGDDE